MKTNPLPPAPITPRSPGRHPFRGNRGSTQGVQIAFSGDAHAKDPTAPTTLVSPSDELDREWSTALRQVRADFQEQGVQPSHGTLECAAWIRMEIDCGWPDGRGIDRETAQEWLKALLSRKAIGRLTDSGRPVVGLAGHPERTNTDLVGGE